jgi:hypothetical protein
VSGPIKAHAPVSGTFRSASAVRTPSNALAEDDAADSRPAVIDPERTSKLLESGHSGNYIGRVGDHVFGDVQQRLATARLASIPCDHHLILVFDTVKLKVRYPFLPQPTGMIEGDCLFVS